MAMAGSPSGLRSWSRTFKKSVRGKHTWTIENFEIVEATLKTGTALKSPEFSAVTCVNDQEFTFTFQLEMYPNNEKKELDAFVSLSLASLNKSKIYVKFSFSVPLVDVQTGNLNYALTNLESCGIGKLFPKEKLHRKLKESPSDTPLIIICHFEVFHGNYVNYGNTSFEIPESMSLEANLAKLYLNNPDLSHPDVTLLCGEKSFPCHKLILSSRSSVFDDMFRKPTKEPSDDIVKISDAEPRDLEKFLRFLYADDLEDIPDLQGISPLLELADKYEVEKLKLVCQNRICAIVTLQNVLDAAKLAYLTNSTYLLAFTMDFMAKDLHKIVVTPEFAEIAKKCPKLLVEILKNDVLTLRKNIQ